MKKPYIICHMMISIDGRIDCAMTSKLPGVDDYYTTLDEINVSTTVSGRVRAELEMAKPYLIVTSEKVSKEYLDYLDGQNISWIACGKEHVDLARAVEILAEKFGVERMGIVGGPKINTAFLEAGLLDEISLLVGAGIDDRGGMPSVFDGLAMEHDVTRLKLIDVKKFDSDAVQIRYQC